MPHFSIVSKSLSVLALVACMGAGCSTYRAVNTQPTRTLAPGESILVRVNSRQKQVSTGLVVATHQEYHIQVARNQWWVDFFIPCSADGYRYRFTEWFMRSHADEKPLPEAPWFALAGRIGTNGSPAFLVNKDWQNVVSQDGELYLFANDAAGWQWNNFGSLKVTVSRVK